MIKISTFCSGIGAAEQAIKELGVNHEVVFCSEIDKYARLSYLANHTTSNMINDMTKCDYVGDEYYSDLNISGLPCQAFSLAGLRKGESDSRGLLFYDFYRYVKNQQPKVFILENVKGLLSSISVSTFDNISLSLLYKFETTKWESFNTQKNNWNSLEITISNYLLMILHQKSELPKQELDILLTKNLELDIENLEQKVKDGLNKRWKYLEEKICQITKKSNSCQEERTQPLEHKDCASDLNHEQSYLIENLKIKVINLLEQTEHINVNTDLFANLISEENSEKMRMFTTLMEINSTMNSQTCIYAVEINIVRCIILALDLYRNLWKEVWSILTKKKEFTSIKTFDIWMSNLSVLGYNLHHTVLNSKNFGVPQNRERVFIVGIRKDLPNDFRFPIGWRLDKRLRDVLETEVDEKYYLSEKMIQGFLNKPTAESYPFKPLDVDKQISSCLTARYFKMGATDPYIQVKEATKQGFAIAGPGDSINISNPNSLTRRGRVGKGIANTLETSCNQVVVEPLLIKFSRTENAKQQRRETGTNNFQDKQIEFVKSNLSNTITTVQKDNLIVEPQVINPLKDKTEFGWHFEQNVFDVKGITRALKSSEGSGNKMKIIEPQLNQIAQLDGFESEGRIYDANGIARTIKDGGGGSAKTGWYKVDENWVTGGLQKHQTPRKDGICPTSTSAIGMGGGQTPITPHNSKIRRLTPLEVFRLQAYPDDFFYKCKAVNSDSQLYKQAGNSITVNVMREIINNLIHILG